MAQPGTAVSGRPRSRRMPRVALLCAVLGGSLALGGCSTAPRASSVLFHAAPAPSTCAKEVSGLTPVGTATPTTLPVSHDNDVGARRLPDSYPDADTDASQAPRAHACPKS